MEIHLPKINVRSKLLDQLDDPKGIRRSNIKE
jgi:hypothetical protein